MSTVVYAAVITGDEPQGYRAGFPDLAEVDVRASAMDELLRLARERLLQALKAREDAGEAWPAPTPLGRVREALRGGDQAVLMVDVDVEDPPVRVNVSIGERLLNRIDAAAATQGMTRSGFLAAAARSRLDAAGAPMGEGAQRLYEEVAAAGRRITETLGPESAVGRMLAEFDARAMEGLRHLGEGVGSAMRGRGRPAADPAAEPSADAA